MLNRMREMETAEAERQAAIANDEQVFEKTDTFDFKKALFFQLPTRTRRLVQSRQLSLTAARVTYNLDGRADTFEVYEDRSRQAEERRRRAAHRRERRANGHRNDEASSLQANQILPTMPMPRVVPTKAVASNDRQNPLIRVQQGYCLLSRAMETPPSLTDALL